jgi:hypothetical protein
VMPVSATVVEGAMVRLCGSVSTGLDALVP